MTSVAECWLIYSREHNAWWAPYERGYCRDVDYAGRYTKRRAAEIVRRAGLDDDGNVKEFLQLAPETLARLLRTCKSVHNELEMFTVEMPETRTPLIPLLTDLAGVVESAGVE